MLDLWLQPADEASMRWAEARSSALSENEMQRLHRYQSSESQALFLIAHVMTRHVLSHYHDRTPESWVFDHGENGRPEVAGGPPSLRFNISHTEGMVAVLVHDDADCGVDVEHPWRAMEIPSVSRRVFTDAEQADLFAQPADRQADRFFQLWTLKEAFIKAKGKGLALPLKQFGFSIRGEQIEFGCDPALDPHPNQWQFSTHRPESGHIVSVASQREVGAKELPITIRSNALSDIR